MTKSGCYARTRFWVPGSAVGGRVQWWWWFTVKDEDDDVNLE